MKPTEIAHVLDDHLCSTQIKNKPISIGTVELVNAVVCRTCGEVGTVTPGRPPMRIHNMHQAQKIAVVLRREARSR